jgi:soluble lytic murein transglycosylase
MELMFPQAYREQVEKYADETGIDPAVLFALIRTESAFQSSVVSTAGAIGLTQLMPATAEETAGRIRREGGPDYTAAENGGLDLTDPGVNIHIGAYYLSYLMGRFEDTLLSFMAYNGGMNRIRRWRTTNTLPPDLFLETIAFAETRGYGRKVMAAAAVYRE